MIVRNGIKIANLSEIKYIEGVSDDDACIDINNLKLPDAPKGYENILISIMYFDTNINSWIHCVSYKTATKGVKIITGGPTYMVAILVGGTDSYKCPNANWRAYYVQQEIAKQ